MRTIYIYAVLIPGICLLGLTACINENKGYKEYYNSMGNNPVLVVPWLAAIRKSFNKQEARISWYEWEEKKYYTVQVFIPTDSLLVSPYTIYEANQENPVVYFHSDDILAPEQDQAYVEFIGNATFLALLWSNEKKYSTVEIQ